jgi:hypothetical protein
MTAKIDGTNGLLQSYDYQTPTTGFSYTFAAGAQTLVMNPAGTLATGTITMPASPADGMTITFSSSQQITALTMAGNGASINSAVTFLPAKTAVAYMYRATGTTWWPIETVPGTGSQLVSGTAVTLSGVTSFSFTGIPSWVKRITIDLAAVTINSSSPNLIFTLGYGATPTYETTGYSANGSLINSAPSAVFFTNISTAFTWANGVSATTDTLSGAIVLTNLSGNTWSMAGLVSRNGNNAVLQFAGYKTISGGALSAIQFNTSTGTNTYTGGTVNILYE